MKNFNFVTDGSRVYRFGNNDWYAVMEDDNKVMLVDTDCKIAGEELETPWSDNNWESENGRMVRLFLTMLMTLLIHISMA